MPVEILKADRVRAILKRGEPGKHYDGGGLVLLVKGPGAASWVLRWQKAGQRRELGLGRARDLRLEDVREIARQARREIALGGDPIAARQARRNQANANTTFRSVAEGVLRQHQRNGHGGQSLAAWRGQLANHILPALGDRPVSAIKRADVLAVIEPLWSTMPSTARDVRRRIEVVLNAAAALELRSTDNPAAWSVLKPLLGTHRGTAGHHAAMPWREVPAFLKRLGAHPGHPARALELVVLTACRTAEVRGMRWDEIAHSSTGDVWTIPASRMKTRVEHVVPLAAAAQRLLKRLHNQRHGAFVFFGQRDGKPISNAALRRVLGELDAGGATVHGFRSSFRDWCGDQAKPREVAEAALAHVVAGVEGVYARTTMLERRRELMAGWAAFCVRAALCVSLVFPLLSGASHA